MFYQHRNLHFPGHGAEEYERKKALKDALSGFHGFSNKEIPAWVVNNYEGLDLTAPVHMSAFKTEPSQVQEVPDTILLNTLLTVKFEKISG